MDLGATACSPMPIPLTAGPPCHYPFVRPQMGDVVLNPGPHDVLLGRGGGTNNYCGNIKFRKLVNEHKMRYLTCSKVEKPNVAREVVQLWRKLNPPGRFLAKRDKDDKKKQDKDKSESSQPTIWIEVGDKKAREKASQCLRERTPDVLPLLRQIKEQQESAKAEAEAEQPASTSDTQPESGVTPDKVQTEVPDKVDMPELPPVPTSAAKAAPRAKRAARTEVEKEEPQARKQARSTPSNSPHHGNANGRDSPTLGSHPRMVDLPPQGEEELADVHGNLSSTAPGPPSMNASQSRSTVENNIARRNSVPVDLHPHHSTAFMDRRGSLPTPNIPGDSCSSFSALDGGGGLPVSFSSHPGAMMQVHGGRGRRAGLSSTCGSDIAAGYGASSAAAAGMGPSYRMPVGGQQQMLPMEAGSYHGASPYMDLYDTTTSPICTARFRQQRLRLQQLKLEQQQLQQQLDQQIQLEVEMHIARVAANNQQRQGPSFVKQHPAPPDYVYQHEDMQHRAHALHPTRSPHHPLQQQQQDGQDFNLQSRHGPGRGVEAPGYLPPSSRVGVDDPILHVQSERVPQHGNHMHFGCKRSDPPTEPYQTKRGPPKLQESFHHPASTPTDGSNAAACGIPNQITPEVPKRVVHLRELPHDIAVEDSSEFPTEVIQKVSRNDSAGGDIKQGEKCSKGEQERALSESHDTNAATDPHSEMTLLEYRKTLDAYVANNNITFTDQIYFEDEQDDSAPDDLSVHSFDGWKDDYQPAPAAAALDESRNELQSPRPDPPARDGQQKTHLNQRAPVPHIPRRPPQRQQSSGHSVVSGKTMRSSFTSLSGLSSMLASTDGGRHHTDDASMEETTGDGKITTKNFSCNESVVSEITVISHTIDGLELGDDE